MIQLTPKAVEKVREIMRDQGLSEGGLRVGVMGGGCSGLSYNLALDTEERPGDKVFVVDGVKLFVDTKSFTPSISKTLSPGRSSVSRARL